MKKIIASIIMFLMFAVTAHAEWDFYFFGINAKMIQEAKPIPIILGVIAAPLVHTAGHYVYAGLNGMDIRQDGFHEILPAGYEARQYREFAQAGFITENLVGLVLTSLPATRQSDFTKGYVAAAFVHTISYPLINQGEKDDLYWSNRHGGNRDWEYVGYSAIATHNLLRVKWYKD